MTDNQREASRANGAKSHGPTTVEGRQRSSMNALKHGLTSATQVVLKNEPREEFDLLRQGYLDRFQPADPVELDLIDQMVAASWRLRRIWPVETDTIDDTLDEVTPMLDKRWNDYPESTRTCAALRALNDGKSNFLTNVTRYESHQSRLYRRALHDLIKIRQLKPPAAPPIETIEQNRPEPVPSCPPEQPAPAISGSAPAGRLLSALCALFLALCSVPGSFCNHDFQAPPPLSQVRFAVVGQVHDLPGFLYSFSATMGYRLPTSSCTGRATELTSGS